MGKAVYRCARMGPNVWERKSPCLLLGYYRDLALLSLFILMLSQGNSRLCFPQLNFNLLLKKNVGGCDSVWNKENNAQGLCFKLCRLHPCTKVLGGRAGDEEILLAQVLPEAMLFCN